MGPTWGLPVADMTQVGPMLATWTSQGPRPQSVVTVFIIIIVLPSPRHPIQYKYYWHSGWGGWGKYENNNKNSGKWLYPRPSQCHRTDSNVCWANPTSGRQYRRWANVGPTFIAVWAASIPCLYEDLCARIRRKEQGQVIASHIYFGM